MKRSTSALERAAQAHADSRRSKGTRYLYRLDFERWLDFCRRNGVDPTRATVSDATRFRDEIQETQAAQSVRRALSALSSMYTAAIDGQDEPLAQRNPFKALPRPPASSYTKTEALTDEEARAVIKAVEYSNGHLGIRDTAIVWILYETGLRVASVVSMRMRDLARSGSQFRVRVTLKGGKSKDLLLPEKSSLALERWLAVSHEDPVSSDYGAEYVFPSKSGIGHLATKAVNKRLAAYGEAAGVAHVHPHRFRATYATEAFDAGLPLREVQASMDHADPKTTLRYDRGERGAGVADAVAQFRAGKRGET